MAHRLSAIIIAENEEASIRRCLESVKWADEIVVVDSGSTDDTLKTCEEYGCRVFNHEWEGYARQKNFAISQAMAMKKPVVGTRVGGIPEQVTDGHTGFLVDKADSEQIASAVLSLLKNPDMAREMGENGRKFVQEKLSLDATLDATERVYNRLLSVL